jgi:hypothetical protein
VVWGASATLGGQSTLVTARTGLTSSDETVAQVAADLVADTANDVVAELREQGVAFVLIAPENPDEPAEARAIRLAAMTALSSRDGLDAVGSTDKGELWRLAGEVQPRAEAPAADRAAAAAVWSGIAVVFAIALLLALPTRGSRSASRGVPRVVGARDLRRRKR